MSMEIQVLLELNKGYGMGSIAWKKSYFEVASEFFPLSAFCVQYMKRFQPYLKIPEFIS